MMGQKFSVLPHTIHTNTYTQRRAYTQHLLTKAVCPGSVFVSTGKSLAEWTGREKCVCAAAVLHVRASYCTPDENHFQSIPWDRRAAGSA